MYQHFLEEAIYAGLEARKLILEVYGQTFSVETKDDNSPVTIADKRADSFLKEYLHKRFPDHGFLTEESEDDLTRLDKDYVWIIDPVDGTMDFVAKDGQFATNIALCYKHEIIVGVIVIPITGEVYYATKGGGSYYLKDGVSTRIHVNDKTDDLTCLTSVFFFNEKELALINKHRDKISKINRFGSSIKSCKIAHGLAEISYRVTTRTKEWDSAAPQIIVEEAGGVFLEPSGKRITYNKEDYHNHHGYIIANRIENFKLQ